ncbi:MAG: ABC transporter ATP-binding protein/permease [Robiginitomaculum sp.]|nr:ABC transporter ATP-binding protein/permease [Robiginitomaculum sp.]
MRHMNQNPENNQSEDAQKEGGIGFALRRVLALLLKPELAKYRPLMVLAILLTLVAKVFSVMSPVFFGNAINSLADGGGELVVRSLIFMLLAWSISRFLAVAFPQLRDAFFVVISLAAVRITAVEAFSHASSLSLQFHLTRKAGSLNRIIERGSNAIEFLMRFLAFNIVPTLIELIMAATVLAIRYGVWFSVIAVATVGSYTVFTLWITELRVKQRRKMNKADNEVRGLSVDSLTNFETVKAFATEQREANRFGVALGVYNKHYIKVMRSLNLLNTGQEFLMGAGVFTIALLAAFMVRDGGLQVGDMTAVVLILLNIYRPLGILGFAWREIKQGAVDLENLDQLVAKNPDIADLPDAPDLRLQEGEIVFEAISFTHQGRSDGIKNISFKVPAGAKVGIVGSSGAGKSTILKLLFRFYDPKHGRILIDGQDIATVKQNSLRQSLGLVPQDVALFNDSLRFNITYARPQATEEEIARALEKAHLTEFIASLPDGLNTKVGERGLKLSGGEKQRVGIARAILKDPKILILDEATSSLDSSTEREVQSALKDAAKGRTSLEIAHRLSTIQDADLILVIEDGTIIEQGTHEQLITINGFYANMWQHQSERKSLDI